MQMKPKNLKYPFVLLGDSFFQKEPASWERLLDFLQANAGESFEVYIPVTETSFADLREYSKKIPALVTSGYIYAQATLEGSVIEVRYCIEDRGLGDEDGFGVEPDEWIAGKMDLQGNFVEKLHLTA
jgi:hypothetical protein